MLYAYQNILASMILLSMGHFRPALHALAAITVCGINEPERSVAAVNWACKVAVWSAPRPGRLSTYSYVVAASPVVGLQNFFCRRSRRFEQPQVFDCNSMKRFLPAAAMLLLATPAFASADAVAAAAGIMSGLILIAYAFGLATYFFPSIIAWFRGHHNTLAIFLLNLLLGWTFLGWVFALVWAAAAVQREAPRYEPRQDARCDPRFDV
jgi:Superinfection immunity protein